VQRLNSSHLKKRAGQKLKEGLRKYPKYQRAILDLGH
jgi:hypothetical protein